MHLLNVPVLPLAIKALIHFWDPDYQCFTFGDVDMVHTIEEYGVLTEFLEDILMQPYYSIVSPTFN